MAIEDHDPDSPVTEEEHEKAWAYARKYYPDAKASGRPGRAFLEDLGLLNEYVPDAVYGYLQFRKGAFSDGPEAGLDHKTKELIEVVMGLALRKTNPVPLGHTRKALLAGATVKEIAEVVAMAMFYCGAITFDESGRHILRAALEFVEARDAEAAASGNGQAVGAAGHPA
jgi:alkylhydroperoxidase/carboxymuconolactone decarboxylase family protein YurZ